MYQQAGEIKVRTERKLGELLPKTINRGTKSHPATLSNLGLTKSDSSRYPRIAAVPEADFEKKMAECRDKRREITREECGRIRDTAGAWRIRGIDHRGYCEPIFHFLDMALPVVSGYFEIIKQSDTIGR